jgi:hypothetical protein
VDPIWDAQSIALSPKLTIQKKNPSKSPDFLRIKHQGAIPFLRKLFCKDSRAYQFVMWALKLD